MDREETIRISRLVASGGLSTSDVSKLLIDYCTVEHDKSIEDTNKLISILLQDMILLSYYVNWALQYYERKFTVYKLLEGSNSFTKKAKIIQIF